jgi:hypothetical protein
VASLPPSILIHLPWTPGAFRQPIFKLTQLPSVRFDLLDESPASSGYIYTFYIHNVYGSDTKFVMLLGFSCSHGRNGSLETNSLSWKQYSASSGSKGQSSQSNSGGEFKVAEDDIRRPSSKEVNKPWNLNAGNQRRSRCTPDYITRIKLALVVRKWASRESAGFVIHTSPLEFLVSREAA